MATTIIAPILNIVSFLCSANNKCCYLLDLQENKEDLNNALVLLKATRADVKRKVDEVENNPNELMKRTHEVDNWLQRVQTIDDEVVQVIQKVDKEIQGRCFGGCPINFWNARKVGKLVLQNLPIVNDLKSRGGLFVDVAYRLPPPLVLREPVDLIVGMESMFDKVWKLLSEDEVRIIGLHGQGGVGKTTLLKLINNAFLQSTSSSSSSSSSSSNSNNNSNNNTHVFDVVILVVVSKVINIDAIQKEIGSRLRLSSTDTRSIFNALTNQNFLLLLDDIWERVDLQSIGVPTPSENNKSKVVFTTRSKTVCGLMEANEMLKVECLPWNEAWSLFEKKVGETALKSFPRARELAEVVAKECGGLPLALVTIGRAMSTKKTVQEWNSAIATLQRYAPEFPGMGEEVLPLLKLRYDNLGDDMIKSCFLFCALYPEDWSINIPKLIDYWIGEGLISLNEFDHIDGARNKGYDVIGILKGAGLLENDRNKDNQVKMHDRFRDLALWIAHDCESRRDKMLIIKMSDIMADSSWDNAERIYVSFIYNVQMGVPATLPTRRSPNLLTLICNWVSPRTSLFIPQNFFSFMPLLRVLDLSYSNMKTFPISITELLELRFLSLQMTGIEVLPEELGKLVKLNYLDLSYMERLKKIPSGVIGSLLELRVLNLFSCCAVWDFDELSGLKHLKDLGININTQHNLNETLLSNNQRRLQMCTRSLHLFSSPSPSPSPSSPSSSTTTTTTTLGFGNMISLEKLELLFNLEKLGLDSLPELMNVKMGVWENHHFQNLGQITIGHCNALKDLTWVGYVGNLKGLAVSHCEEIVIVIGDDFGGSTGGGDEITMVMNNVEDVFKRLESLVLTFLPKLKSICSHALAFPCLESILVGKCPQLKKLPFHSDSNVNNTLQSITGERKWWIELQWEEDHDNKELLSLLESKFLPYFQPFD